MYTIYIENDISHLREIIQTDPVTGQDEVAYVDKTNVQLEYEKRELLEAKTLEITALCNDYFNALKSQPVGAPAPVADFHIMNIVNSHNGEFVVKFEGEE